MQSGHISQKKSMQFLNSMRRLPYFLPAALIFLTLLVSMFCMSIVASWLEIFIPLVACIITIALTASIARTIIEQQQKDQKDLIAQISSTCQAIIEGKKAEPIHVAQDNEEVINLTAIINTLLEENIKSQKEATANKQELTTLHTQIERFTKTIRPVADGDLRINKTPMTGKLEEITTICTELVEDTAQLIIWAQDMSKHIIQIAHQLMSQSVEITQSTEKLIEQDVTTVHSLENLVILAQRLERTLSSDLEIFQEGWAYLQRKQRLVNTHATPTNSRQNNPTTEPDWLPGSLNEALTTINPTEERFNSVPQLQNLLGRAHEISSLAEQTAANHDAFAQIVYQINEVIMQFSSMVNLMATLADRWRQATENYTLPINEINDISQF
jgi:phosphate/sulfate permease